MNKKRPALLGGPSAVAAGMVKPWPEIRPEDKAAVMRVLDRNILWGGNAPEISALEQEWADWSGAKYCISANSGTAALHMAVAAVGVQPGDEVITTPFSWTSTATCILHHNAIPVFADIDPRTYNIDAAKIEAKITPQTKAIIVVHLYGLAADIDPIMEVAARHHLKVIEDCCQSHGAEYKGRKIGNFGDVAAFSLNGNKNLSAGEGGLLITNNEHVWSEAASVQQFGERRVKDGAREYNAYGMGWMYRMTEMTAAFARSQLSRLDEITATIRENALYLTEGIKDIAGFSTPYVPDNCKHVYYRFSLHFTPEKMGIQMPLEDYVRKVRTALDAEGVNLARAEFVIPAMTLFQQRQGYGKGCPWSCNHYHGDVSYNAEDYPVTLDTMKRVMAPLGFTPPNGRALMDQYIEAIHKVYDNLDEVLAADC
jgi:perosamine synthetase